MSKKIDLTGRQFGRLIVIRELPKRQKCRRIVWECRCTCGNITNVQGGHLASGHTTSCGCKTKKYSDRSMCAKNALLSRYKFNAKAKKIDFRLSFDEFVTITGKKCFYCGQLPTQLYTAHTKSSKYYYNGVDRVNNNIGYVIGNCVPCCKYCNYAKVTRSQKDFIQWVKKIYNNLENKGYF